jgi:hypothetical protein
MVKVFGPEKWAVRFPSALFHILASAAFFFLASKYSRNRCICLGGAILPWLFPLSRTGIGGYMAMLLGIICGWYFLLDAMERRSTLSAALAGLSWAFAMYSHQIGRPMTAVILACFALSFNVLLFRRWKTCAVFIAVLVLSLVPMMIYVFNNPESMTKRFSTISAWSEGGGFSGSLLGIAQRYLEYFSPSFLFFTGDGNLRHNTGLGGELYVALIPFLIAGLWRLVKYFRKNPEYRFVLTGIVVYPVAAVL